MPDNQDNALVTPQIFADLPLGAKDEAHFQFKAYADTIARIIANPQTDTPFTIGVSGEWGDGQDDTDAGRARPAGSDRRRG